MMKRKVISFLLMLVLLVNFIPMSDVQVYAANAFNSTFMCGVWEGRYSGFKNSTIIDRNIRLDIDKCNENGRIEGFATIDDGDNGKYFFEGTVDFETGEISFEGTTWLYNPNNFSFASFLGNVDATSCIIEGNVDASEEKKFSLSKTSSNFQSYSIDIGSLSKDYTGEYDGHSGDIVVRRNIEIHIKNIENGSIFGTAVISPSSKANSSYGANGSYYFNGTLDDRTGKISLQGYEWIDYPVQYDNFTFVALNGYIDAKNGVIIGTSEEGIWAMETINYSDVNNDTGFTLGVDNNNFVHTSSSSWDGAGFSGMKNYSIDDEYFKKLTANSSKSEKNRIKKEMNKDWGGSCYGIAMSMGLLYEKYISLDDLTDSKNAINYHSMDYPCNDKKLRNMINYYQLSQSLENGGKSTSAVSAAYNTNLFTRLKNWFCGDDSLSVFLKYLVNYASQDHVELMGFSTSDGGHAVLVVGCEYDEDAEQYVVKIYDENSVDSSKSNGKFSYMRIEKDFSSFVYTDSNGDKITNSSYRTIYFLDWDSLGNIVPSAPAQSSNHAKINFLLGDNFKVVDDDGNYLEYDGNEFSGDMNIYDVDTVEYDDGTHIIIETDNFSSVKFSEIKNQIDVDVYNDNDYQSLSGKNIEAAKMTFDEGIKLEGQDYTFKAYLSTSDISDDEAGLVSVSANAKSDVSLDESGDKIHVTSSETMTNIVSENLNGTNVTKMSQENSNNLTVSSSESDSVLVTNITLSSEKSSITVGETIDMNATVLPEDATYKKLTWSSSDETIATIDRNGKVKGIKAGKVIISAKSNDGSGVSGTTIINVVEKDYSSTDKKITDISKARVVLEKNSYVYTGGVIEPGIQFVSLNDKILNEATDYNVIYKNNRNSGTAQVIINGKGNYNGSVQVNFKIKKASVFFKNTNKTLKYSKLKKKKQSYSVIKSGGVGRVSATYIKKGKISKIICKKYISVSKKGKVVVKKGAKKGTYKIKITVAQKNNYKKTSKIIYIKVR